MAEKKKKSTNSKKITKIKTSKDSKTKTKTKINKTKVDNSKKTKKTIKSSVVENKEEQKLVVSEHKLVPEHKLLDDKEKKELFEKYNIELKNLPKILITDKAITHINPKEGDVIRIIRKSRTAGRTVFYRGVVNE